MNTNPPSVKDVAALASVSVGTVSNFLNRPEVVSPGTRAKVQRAIDQLGFVRNESARQLRSGSSRTLAYVVLDATNPFFTDVAAGIEEAAAEHELALFLCSSHQSVEREQDYLDLLLEQRVRGVMLTPVDPAATRLAGLRSAGVPVVLVDRAEAAGDACSVSVDDVEGGLIVGRHLISGGHPLVGFVGGPFHLAQVSDRRTGLERALASAGRDVSSLVVVETSALDVPEGRRAAGLLAALPLASRPTAVFCANDLLALGFLQELTRLGLRVPDDIAIVGYDDIQFAAAATVPLTSVRQASHLLGRTAAELLLAEASEGVGHVHRQLEFEPELVVRASSHPS